MINFRYLLFLALTLGLGCSSPPQPGQVSGTVSWQGKPVAMALVEAYTKAERDLTTPPVGETPSAEDGRYQLQLPPGTYWIWAKATVAEPGNSREQRLVGQATANPVEVATGGDHQADLALADATGFSSATGPAGAGARGAVTGAPSREITVYVYLGHQERPLGPSFSAAVVPSEDGTFRADLVPGAYTLAARWRTSGADFGTLQPGDRVAVTPITVNAGRYTEVGVLELRPVDAELWKQRTSSTPETGLSVTGRVVDAAGNPKAGMRVLIFDDPRMAGKPLTLSPATGADGTFEAALPGPGTYFLGARSRIGGPAQPGEWTGAYRGEDGDGIHAAGGQRVGGIVIEVEEIW